MILPNVRVHENLFTCSRVATDRRTSRYGELNRHSFANFLYRRSENTLNLFSLLSLYWQKWKEAYKVTLLSVCPLSVGVAPKFLLGGLWDHFAVCVVSLRSVSYQRKIGDCYFPELLAVVYFFFSFGASAPIWALAYIHETLRFTSVY
jgi:hypothetical protein